MTGRVSALFVHPPEHWADMSAVGEVRVTTKGIDGDVHAGRGKRALLLVEAGDLLDLGLAPGDLREQVTVELPGLMGLAAGTRLSIGDAVLEVTGPCEPCTHIGEHVGAPDASAFRDRLKGRRGLLARVASVDGDGAVRVGDAVRALALAEPG